MAYQAQFFFLRPEYGRIGKTTFGKNRLQFITGMNLHPFNKSRPSLIGRVAYLTTDKKRSTGL